MVSPNEMPPTRTPRSSPPTVQPTTSSSYPSRHYREPDSNVEKNYLYLQIIVAADMADTVYNRDGIEVAAVLIDEGCQYIEQAGLTDTWFQKSMLATGKEQELLISSVLMLQRYQQMLHTREQD